MEETSGSATEEGSLFQDGQTCPKSNNYFFNKLQFNV